MQSIVLIIHVIAASILIGLVLIQQGKGADMGAAFGAGASATVFGARGSGSFLSRATAIAATIFFVTSLSLAYFSGHNVARKSVTEIVPPAASVPAAPQAPEQPKAPAKQQPEVPVTK